MIRALAIIFALGLGTNAFAASGMIKECNGGKNSESTIGTYIVLEILPDKIKVRSTLGGYADAIGSYAANPNSKTVPAGFLEYQDGMPDQNDGLRFQVDANLTKFGTTGKVSIRLLSGVEGYLDSEYTCHDMGAK